MRISDWSSDVCSSDLQCPLCQGQAQDRRIRGGAKTIDLEAQREDLRQREVIDNRLQHVDATADRREELGVHVKIGRAWCRERVGQYVSISVVAGRVKKQKQKR